MKILTVPEQRAQQTARLLTSAFLELQLRSLVRAALRGDARATADFQQLIQYAPTEMRTRIDTLITNKEAR